MTLSCIAEALWKKPYLEIRRVRDVRYTYRSTAVTTRLFSVTSGGLSMSLGGDGHSNQIIKFSHKKGVV